MAGGEVTQTRTGNHPVTRPSVHHVRWHWATPQAEVVLAAVLESARGPATRIWSSHS